MTDRRLNKLSLPDLEVTPSYEGRGLSLSFKGTADMRHAPALKVFLTEVHAEAGAHSVKEVVADLLQLEFMASSCFKCFVTWLNLVREGATHRYKIRFVTSGDHQWQRRSVEALRAFAPVITVVDSMPPSARK
jgi:hypothetical protein